MSHTTADDTKRSKSTEDEEESEAIEIQQVHNVLNKTTHDAKDTSDQKSVTEIETYAPTKNGEKIWQNRINSLLPIYKLKLKTKS